MMKNLTLAAVAMMSTMAIGAAPAEAGWKKHHNWGFKVIYKKHHNYDCFWKKVKVYDHYEDVWYWTKVKICHH